jgi:hypothetical protein
MATGEKVFSTRGRTTTKYNFEPPAPGEYEFKIRGASVAIGCKPEPGSVPYVKVQLEALNTATDASNGRNKLVFHMLFLNTSPMGNGFILTDKGGQIVDLAHALGEEPNIPILDHDAKVKVGKDEYEMKTVEILDPQAVKQWLVDHDGATVRGKVKHRKRDDGSVEGTIDFFIQGENAVDPFAEEVTPISKAARR